MDDALVAWLASPIGQYAAAYKGCAIIPLHGIVNGKCTCKKSDCSKSAGKHPFTKNGLKDASTNIEEIAALFQYRADLNIGVVTGSVSGFFALDVDGNKGGFESLDKLINTYGDLPPTVIVETNSGVHLWFNYPKDIEIKNRTEFMPGLDIRGQNGYVVAPPSNHVSGKVYKFTETSTSKTADASQWLLDIIQAPKKEDRKPLSRDHSTGARSEWSIEDVQKMLDTIDPDTPYDEWLKTGMALHSGGFPLSIWDSWSRTGEKFENGDCEKRWHGFTANHGITMGTLVNRATLNGWKPSLKERPAVDTSNVEPLVRKAQAILNPAEKKSSALSLCFNAIETPGLIGDTVRWITKYAIRKQPELALINTLAFAGAVFGRRYKSPLNTRTNLYAVGIANTGDGKDHSRKSIKDLAHACGLDARIGADDIRSDSGMLRGLMNNSSQIMMLDEFGHFLQGISDEKSPHYIRSQAKILLKLYSSSNSIYNHGDYADAKAEPIIIHYPNLCIYGTSTEEKYAKSLKKSAIESGELNRFITIRGRPDKEYPDRKMPEYEIDQNLLDRWGAFSAKLGDSIGVMINNSQIAPDPILIPWGKCDDIQYAIQCRQVDKVSGNSPLRHLWGRLFENTVKIAMIFAIARNMDSPQFEKEDFDIAQMIVESSVEYLTSLAGNHMSENQQEESNNDIVNAIIAEGGKMGRRDIMRKFRKLKKRELDEILNSLIEQEVLDVEKLSEGGRPKTYYKIIQDISLAS
jgi:hypothetical protein